jgi:hypothetical protein
MFLKNYIFLFIIIIFLSFILCEDEEEDSGDICDCGNTDTNKTCCFIETNETSSIKCEAFDKNILFAKDFLLDEININITCNKEYSKNTCGTNNPKKLFQCREHSSNANTCCMISINGNTNCILADAKVEINYTFPDNEDIKNVELNCSENYVNFNLIGIGIKNKKISFFVVFIVGMLFYL